MPLFPRKSPTLICMLVIIALFLAQGLASGQTPTGPYSYKRLSTEDLQKILKSHAEWLMSHKVLRSAEAQKDQRRADLNGADLSGAYLNGADLRGADLKGVHLSRADLSGANLSSADLRGANLRGADLRGANLIGTLLDGADLRDADLSGTLLGARH